MCRNLFRFHLVNSYGKKLKTIKDHDSRDIQANVCSLIIFDCRER